MRLGNYGKINPMKILLTGHLGYIGTVLTPMLLDRGHDVTGLDSDLFAKCTFTGSITAIPSISTDIRTFVAEKNIAGDALGGFDAIIHLAGLSNDPLGDYRPSLTADINSKASIELAQLAKVAGIRRFIFASSCSNYGASSSDFITEAGAFNPVTPYGESKASVELALSSLASDCFSPTFVRASTAYGLSPRIRFDLVVNNLLAWAVTTGEVYIKSDGAPWRPIVHVEDIARAYISIAEAPIEDVHLEAFNVGQTSENYQVREIAEIVKDVVPGARLSFAPNAGPDLRNYRVDCNHIARKLHGWKPQWTCKRGVEQLLDTYVKENLTLDDFEGNRFKRIAHVKHLIEIKEITQDLFRIF